MAITAHDVQVFLWKMIKLSSKACFNVCVNHPYITSCSLFFFLLYMFCPLFFWILIYILPFAVPTWAYITIRRRRKCKEERREEERESTAKKTNFELPPPAEEEEGEDADKFTKERRKKSFSRVHSVRRRRPKEIEPEDYNSNAVTEYERNAASSTTGDTKATSVEEENWENHEFYHDSDLMRSLRLLSDDEDKDEANKAMDVTISDAERIKRLENLIARRKSRKMLSHQLRRSLMTGEASPIAPMIIPKINTFSSPSRAGSSPVPGSAPSVLIPMRNPFDLPYDPQEEKPDLTGDTFGQEFKSGPNREMMLCRHESFTLGPSLPSDFFDDTSSLDDFGFRRRRSSIGYNFDFSKQEFDTDFGPTTDADSAQESESKSNVDSPDDDDEDDRIKEVIQIAKDQSKEEVANAQEELRSSSSSNSSSSSHSSSEDERPVRIINREAILKSLSMRRNSVPDIDTSENLHENNLSYANSALENASRLKQQYYADKPQKRHGMTFSIASDMQVEVSEISSPPLTIDENMSYRDDTEMERNTSWDGLDSWAGSSRLSEVEDNDTRPPRGPEAGGSGRRRRGGNTPPLPNSMDVRHLVHSAPPSSSSSSSSSLTESSENGESEAITTPTREEEVVAESNVNSEGVGRVEEGEASSTNEAAVDAQERPLAVHQPTISPKSVLQPTLSIASFDPEPDPDDESQRAGNAAQNSTPLMVQFTVANGESSGSSGASTSGVKDTPDSSNGKQKILEDYDPKEEGGGSSSRIREECGLTSTASNESVEQLKEAAGSSKDVSKKNDEKEVGIQEDGQIGDSIPQEGKGEVDVGGSRQEQ